MASIHLRPESGVYHLSLNFFGRPAQKSLKTKDKAEAETRKSLIVSTIKAIKDGWLSFPAGCDHWEFVFHGGKLVSVPDQVTLEQLFDKYEQEMPSGAMEKNSLATHGYHRKHLLRVVGGKKPAQQIDTSAMQRYVNSRV